MDSCAQLSLSECVGKYVGLRRFSLGFQNGGRSCFDATFGQNMLQVFLHGAVGAAENEGDFIVAFALADPMQHFLLTGRELRWRGHVTGCGFKHF